MTTETLVLPAAIYEEIIAHTREGHPEEVCGILSGTAGVATSLVRGRNVAEQREINYTVDAQTLLRQFDFEEAGEEMIAIYHSHPATEAHPSATDARQATYPDAVYLICSLQHADAPILRGYRLLPQPFGGALSDYKMSPVRGLSDFLAYQNGAPDPFYLLHLSEAGRNPLTQVVRIREVEIMRRLP